MKQQGGFTLIELIVVIVILGILAATALPKFSGLSADARVAKMAGIAAALKDGAVMAHGQYLAEQTASNASVVLEDGTAIDLYNGYPDADVSGIKAALDTGITSDPSLTISPSGLPSAAGALTIVFTNYTNCEASYVTAVGSAEPVVASVASSTSCQ